MLAHGFAGADAEHARALDQDEIGAREPDAAGEADHEDARAPGNAAQAVFENLAADGIEYHIRTATIGDALDGVAERLAPVEHEVIGAAGLRHPEFFLGRGRGDPRHADHLAGPDRVDPNAADSAV